MGTVTSTSMSLGQAQSRRLPWDLCGWHDHGHPPGPGQLGLTPDQPGEIATVLRTRRLAGAAETQAFGTRRQERGGQ
jgi:hypothetical protein